jgi:hypothetical protein
MANELVCWRCGASLAALSLPFGRTEECPACRSPLHVCRMCVNWAPERPKKCREDDAEEVREKERPNFCDWYRPRPGAFDAAAADAAAAARKKLEDLFR